MNFEEYRQRPGMNWSRLKDMAVSPKLFRWRMDHPRPDTATFRRGRATHCGWLEPGAYASRYAAEPAFEHDGRTKLGKTERADWRALHENCEILSAGDAATVDHCVASLRAHPDAVALLGGAQVEVPVEWVDPGTGVACKARLDLVKPGVVGELKTCRELAWFHSDARKYLYFGQLAWYLDGALAKSVVEPDARTTIAAVETAAPYDCGEVRLDSMAIERGRALYRRLLELYVQCSETDLWPGQMPTPQTLRLPVQMAEIEAGFNEPEGW